MARRRSPDLRRRRYRREPRRRFIVFCEGKNTEPAYFQALRRTYSTALIEIETIGKAGVPYELASKAASHARSIGLSKRSRRALDSFERNDEVWAVFDRDKHPRFDEAVALCEREGIGVGRSNPCFELWLILHIGDYDRPDEPRALQKELEGRCAEYKQKGSKVPNCTELVACVAEAEGRAEAQLQRRADEGTPFGTPSTTVGNLTRAIRAAAEKAK